MKRWIHANMDTNLITIDSDQMQILKDYLFNKLQKIGKQHPQCAPKANMSFDDLVERYCEWGAFYNGEYIPEMRAQDGIDDDLDLYLKYEFEDYLDNLERS